MSQHVLPHLLSPAVLHPSVAPLLYLYQACCCLPPLILFIIESRRHSTATSHATRRRTRTRAPHCQPHHPPPPIWRGSPRQLPVTRNKIAVSLQNKTHVFSAREDATCKVPEMICGLNDIWSAGATLQWRFGVFDVSNQNVYRMIICVKTEDIH